MISFIIFYFCLFKKSYNTKFPNSIILISNYFSSKKNNNNFAFIIVKKYRRDVQ